MEGMKFFLFIFLRASLECVGRSFAYFAHLQPWVRIRTKSAAVARYAFLRGNCPKIYFRMLPYSDLFSKLKKSKEISTA
jgi:hypothetical protein